MFGKIFGVVCFMLAITASVGILFVGYIIATSEAGCI
jgi:hypothetical protein